MMNLLMLLSFTLSGGVTQFAVVKSVRFGDSAHTIDPKRIESGVHVTDPFPF
jgi:hypothetical protein